MSFLNLKESIGLRFMIIALLVIVLLIPTFMIQVLIEERQKRKDETTSEVTNKWGNPQTVSGPVLVVPYQFYSEKGESTTILKHAYFLPDNLEISGIIYPEIRYRGIYKVVLYRTLLKLSGSFSLPDFTNLSVPKNSIIWKDTFFALGITDMKGINEQIVIKWNGQDLVANPGTGDINLISTGISAKTVIDQEQKKYVFSSEINLNGSDNLMFLPVGKQTKLQLSSDWSNPSFAGSFVPDSRKISKDGFNANWKIFNLNRNYPQKWTDEKTDIESTSFGVELLLPVNDYQKNMRTLKYAVMFIFLTFLTFLMFELLNNKVIHPVQYILIGFAIIIFYTLLLSLSEHIGFNTAYLIASLAIIVIITAYSKSALLDNKQTLIILAVLIVLYSYLFIVLQLQDFALLMGSIGLVIILSIVMYLTRKIDWFALMGNKS